MSPQVPDRRVAVVAGVGPGIGRACALALAADGCDVVLGARDRSRIEDIADEVRDEGRRAMAVPTDITDPDQSRALADVAAERWGRLDVVVNVAAWSGPPAAVADLDDDVLRTAFDVNVVGALAVSRAAVPHLRASGGGAIVQIAALSSYTLLPRLAAYTATKQAMVTASLTMAREEGRHGIRVNVVVPGFTAGEGLDAYIDGIAARRGVDRGTVAAELVAGSALRRLPEPVDIAEAVRFLASPAARCITGQQLHVNAGEWIG